MKYDFDTHIDRSGTDSVKWHVAKNELPMWVADMDFKTAPEITAELRKRLDRDAFGYTIIPDRWYDSARDISVTCLSPTKAFNIAGIHTAAVCVPNENLRHRAWRALNTYEVAEPDVFACEAAIAAYNEGEAWLDELCAYLWQNRQAAADFITEKIPLIHPIPGEATYLLWVDIRALKDHGRGFARFLRRKTGLFISDGASYGKTGEGFIRINLACPRDMVLDGMERLKKGVDLPEN